MLDFSSVLGAAQGQAPSREVVAAREGLTLAQRRAASRAVRRGEAADDPGVARLAVAQARLVVRRRPGAGLIVFFAAMVALWLGFAVWAFAAGHLALGLLLAATVPSGVWALWRLRPAGFASAREADRRNREALERAGCPYVEDPAGAEPARMPPVAIAAGVVVVWIFQDVIYGTALDLFDGRPYTLGHAVLRGALFATLMSVVSLTLMRRRTQRQSQRPIA